MTHPGKSSRMRHGFFSMVTQQTPQTPQTQQTPLRRQITELRRPCAIQALERTMQCCRRMQGEGDS